MGSGFKGHVVMLCLDYRLFLAKVKLQSDRGLGEAFSGMLPWVEGMHTLGYLDEEVYELYKNKYSVTLEEAHNMKNMSPLEREKQRTRKAYCKTASKEFGNVLNQWATMKPSSKEYWIKEAQKPENANVRNAKLILELAEQEMKT